VAKKLARPWDMSKGFDHSAPISRIVPASQIGHPKRGRITLRVNGEARQGADIGEMIWDVPHLVANLSSYVTLKPGDLIFTGTPAGVAAASRGDRLEGEIEGVAKVVTTIV
jgi:fumarylpyruvate hydrolase